MTPSEFKAWFDGFTEAFAGEPPTGKQWKRILARITEIDGKAVTERVYVERYVPQYPYYARPYWQYLGTGLAQCGLSQNAVSNNTAAIPLSFSSVNAMCDLGRAEAQSLSA
jgi:hypothetical protein